MIRDAIIRAGGPRLLWLMAGVVLGLGVQEMFGHRADAQSVTPGDAAGRFVDLESLGQYLGAITEEGDIYVRFNSIEYTRDRGVDWDEAEQGGWVNLGRVAVSPR